MSKVTLRNLGTKIPTLSTKIRTSGLSLDTHDYDGKLGYLIEEYQPRISYASSIDLQTKLSAFARMQDELSKKEEFKGDAHKNFATIVADYKICEHRGSNYDASNNLNAADLLYICSEVLFVCQIKDTNIPEIIIEQLAGMSGGMCAQGRTHRLLGIIPALLQALPL